MNTNSQRYIPKKIVDSLPGRLQTVIDANSTLMPMVLEWDDQQAYMDVMFRCPHAQ